MAENGKYLIGESLREKLKSTIAKVDSIPFGGPVSRIPTVIEGGDTYAPKTTKLAAYAISGGPWVKGTARPVEFYTVNQNGIFPSGVTATAGNVSVDFSPMAYTSSGTAAGPTPSMAWAIVSKDQNGNYIAVEAEQSPIIRVATREITDWQLRETQYVLPTGTTSVMQAVPALNLFGSYSKLDAPLGVIYAKSPIGENGNTANVVIGPPPIPLHSAVYTTGGNWARGESREVVAFPSEGTTTPRTVSVSNPYLDAIPTGDQPLAIGKFGTSYSVIAGAQPPGVMLATRDTTNQPWVRGSQRTVQITGSTSTVTVFSAFDDYTPLDLPHGLSYTKSQYAPAGGTANVVIGPPPIPMHNVLYTAGGSWTRGDTKPVVVPPSSGVTQTRTVQVNNPYFDTIDDGEQPLAIGKFGTAYSVIAGPDAATIKFADRTDSEQWERGSSRGVRIQGTTNEVQAVNFVGHYEGFDGRGPSGVPGLVIAKGRAIGGASGTAFYVISPPPITFRTGTFTGQWGKGSSKSITLTSSPTGTITVMNNFGTVGTTASGAGAQQCAMSKEGSQWYLIAAEC